MSRKLLLWAKQAESCPDNDWRLPPPGEIFDHQDLIEKAWGWERLVPWHEKSDFSTYKDYLKEYHRCNPAESIAQAWRKNEKQDSAAGGNGVNDVNPLVRSCIEMEKQLISECERQGKGDATADDVSLSKAIQERALGLKNMDRFPASAAALMCITNMAEMLCLWLKRGTYYPGSTESVVRRDALDLMMYSGSESACAAAVMLGIAKEANIILEYLRQGFELCPIPLPMTIMRNAWLVLEMIHEEILDAVNWHGTAPTEAGNSEWINTVLYHKKADKEKGSAEFGYELANWIDRFESWPDTETKLPPPGEIFDRLDLIGKLWEWERLVPLDDFCNLSKYKNYLKKYHCHNTAESIAKAWQNEQGASAVGNGNINGNELTPLANLVCPNELEVSDAGNGVSDGSGHAPLVCLCVKMEKKFISECERRSNVDTAADDISLSNEIQKCALSLNNMDQFPVSTAALMCITKLAEVLCLWVELGTYYPKSMVTVVRRCSLNIMRYRGSESACAAALMVAIAKEAKVILEYVSQGIILSRVPLPKTIMENAWDVLEIIHDDIQSAEAGNSERFNTVGEVGTEYKSDSEEVGTEGYDKKETREHKSDQKKIKQTMKDKGGNRTTVSRIL